MGECDSKPIKEINPGAAKRVPLSNYNESAKSVCKITFKQTSKSATGFFCNDSYKNRFLITNQHVISPETVRLNPTITIEIYDRKTFDLNLRSNQINIQYFSSLDITLIQINNLNELCNRIKFLEIDLNYKKGYQVYLNNDIITLGYPLGKTVECCPGKITQIMDNEFKHNCDTDHGSSGSPIILASNLNVIGIHTGGVKNNKEAFNLGTFIGTIMNNNINNSINNYNMNNKNTKTITNILPNNEKRIIRKSNKNENYIIASFKIDSKDAYSDIRIINSYEASKRRDSNFKFDENLRNEKEIKQCKIQVEGKFIPFSYTYKFGSIGYFKIIYFFQNDIKRLNYMFYGCSNLTNLDLSNFNTQNVTNMREMFCGCSNLTNLDLSNFNTKNVTDMIGMFYGCSNLTNLDLSNFNTKNVTDMNEMFANCSNLTNLDLSNFNTKNVTNMMGMFYGCSNLTNLDLSNFNTKNVTDMSRMFANCSNLTNLDLSNFNAQNVTDMSEMFEKTDKLPLSNIICYDEKLLSKAKIKY